MSDNIASSLDAACVQVIKYIRTLKGIKHAPDRPPESMSEFPYAIAYPGGGDWNWGPSQTKMGLHAIVVELHVGRKDLANDVKGANVYSDSIPDILMSKLLYDNQWNRTVSTFEKISYTFGPLGWGDATTFGFRFRVENVKLITPITTY